MTTVREFKTDREHILAKIERLNKYRLKILGYEVVYPKAIARIEGNIQAWQRVLTKFDLVEPKLMPAGFIHESPKGDQTYDPLSLTDAEITAGWSQTQLYRRVR